MLLRVVFLTSLVVLTVLGVTVAQAAADDPSHCVSTNGVVRAQMGTAACETGEGEGVVAIAKGEGSSASNVCDSSQAKAFGAGTSAEISTFPPGASCDHNAATSTGDQSRAEVSGTGGAGRGTPRSRPVTTARRSSAMPATARQ